MKKIMLIFLLTLSLIGSPFQAKSTPVSDSGGYKGGQKAQENADKENQDKKQDSKTETSIKNRILGSISNFTNDSMAFLDLQKAPEDVSAALSEKGKGSSEKLPEGVNGSNFFKKTLLSSSTEKGESGAQAAGIAKNAQSKDKRERALVETATFGYALAAIHKEQASRNLNGGKSIDKQVQGKTNSAKNYSSAVSGNTSVKMSTAQIYNAIVLTSAVNNMLTAISAADYITDTNISYKNVVSGMAIQAVGASLGGFLE